MILSLGDTKKPSGRSGASAPAQEPRRESDVYEVFGVLKQQRRDYQCALLMQGKHFRSGSCA